MAHIHLYWGETKENQKRKSLGNSKEERRGSEEVGLGHKVVSSSKKKSAVNESKKDRQKEK